MKYWKFQVNEIEKVGFIAAFTGSGNLFIYFFESIFAVENSINFLCIISEDQFEDLNIQIL
jgi:hypothetical protein